MDFFEQVRRLTITALFSDDVLFEHLVLKRGNAISLIHGLGLRASFDLDFSLANDFEDVGDAQRRAQQALERRFLSAGYRVFDFEFQSKPKLEGPDERPWWGGYQLEFKLLTIQNYDRLNERPERRRLQALAIGPRQQRKLRVDISKHEYVAGHIEQDLDYFTIRVYTPQMVAAEKMRALCQQMEDYSLRGAKNARARDFYDIYLAVAVGGAQLNDADGRHLLRAMFAAKEVPLESLARLESEREFHRPDWPSVVQSVPEALESFDFYFDFVIAEVRALEALWNE
jgi:Nucleotidyl transferase AbiEii toxin, Type IV TA system